MENSRPDPKPTMVEKSELQYDVHFSSPDAVVGVHVNDAVDEADAVKQAIAIYKETIEYKDSIKE